MGFRCHHVSLPKDVSVVLWVVRDLTAIYIQNLTGERSKGDLQSDDDVASLDLDSRT